MKLKEIWSNMDTRRCLIFVIIAYMVALILVTVISILTPGCTPIHRGLIVYKGYNPPTRVEDQLVKSEGNHFFILKEEDTNNVWKVDVPEEIFGEYQKYEMYTFSKGDKDVAWLYHLIIMESYGGGRNDITGKD